MFNAGGGQEGAIQGNNFKNKDLSAGHIGGGVSGKGKGYGKGDGKGENGGTGAGVGAGVGVGSGTGVGKGGDQLGNNILNQGVAMHNKFGDVFKDGIVGRNKGVDYWAKKK